MIPAIDPAYARRAIEAKALARRNKSGVYLPCFVGALVGASVGMLWIILGTDAGPAPLKRVLVCMTGGIVAALYVYGIRRLRHPSDKAQCPDCKYDWEIHELGTPGNPFPMTEWDKCPGCGALMNDDLLAIAVARGRGLSGLAVSEYLEKQQREQT